MNAIEKLNNEKAKAQSNYEKMVADAIIKRCKESKALCEDVLKANKTLENCFAYIKDNAKKEAKNGCAVIEDSVVFEWAEDYYHAQDLEIDKPKPEPQKFDVNKAVAKATASVKTPVKASPQKSKATVVPMPNWQSKPKKQVLDMNKPTKQVKANEQFSLFDF